MGQHQKLLGQPGFFQEDVIGQDLEPFYPGSWGIPEGHPFRDPLQKSLVVAGIEVNLEAASVRYLLGGFSEHETLGRICAVKSSS